MNYFHAINPYEVGESSKRIFTILKAITNYHDLPQKYFFEVRTRLPFIMHPENSCFNVVFPAVIKRMSKGKRIWQNHFKI
jgi:hypothetical protein